MIAEYNIQDNGIYTFIVKVITLTNDRKTFLKNKYEIIEKAKLKDPNIDKLLKLTEFNNKLIDEEDTINIDYIKMKCKQIYDTIDKICAKNIDPYDYDIEYDNEYGGSLDDLDEHHTKVEIWHYVYDNDDNDNINDDILPIPKKDNTKPFLTFNDPESIYIGTCHKLSKHHTIGNTILLKIKDNEYIYIGPSIIKFKPIENNEEIIAFMSPMYGTNSSHAYALSSKYVYLFDYIYVAIELNNIPSNIKDMEDYHTKLKDTESKKFEYTFLQKRQIDINEETLSSPISNAKNPEIPSSSSSLLVTDTKNPET